MKNVSDSLDEIISMVNRLDEKLDSIIEKNEEESYKKGYDKAFNGAIKYMNEENETTHNKYIK